MSTETLPALFSSQHWVRGKALDDTAGPRNVLLRLMPWEPEGHLPLPSDTKRPFALSSTRVGVLGLSNLSPPSFHAALSPSVLSALLLLLSWGAGCPPVASATLPGVVAPLSAEVVRAGRRLRVALAPSVHFLLMHNLPGREGSRGSVHSWGHFLGVVAAAGVGWGGGQPCSLSKDWGLILTCTRPQLPAFTLTWNTLEFQSAKGEEVCSRHLRASETPRGPHQGSLRRGPKDALAWELVSCDLAPRSAPCLFCVVRKLRIICMFSNGLKKSKEKEYFMIHENDMKSKLLCTSIKFYWNRATPIQVRTACSCFCPMGAVGLVHKDENTHCPTCAEESTQA